MPEKPIYKSIVPGAVSVSEFHSFLLGAVSPRPIALASTVDNNGASNLSPFSFFNVFGSNPPILIFSPARRVRDNSNKHTLENIGEVGEVVINIVNYAMIEQVSLSSCEYEKGVNEFTKAGLTSLPSHIIRPARVAESPAAFECKVNQIIETGTEGGAGNLIICEVLVAHIKTDVLDEAGFIDSRKIDTMARMGGDWYCRAHGDAVLSIEKPNIKNGIGVDQIPQKIKNSEVLTGNDLGKLGNVNSLPTKDDLKSFSSNDRLQAMLSENNLKIPIELRLHALAKAFLLEGKIMEAWKTLLQEF